MGRDYISPQDVANTTLYFSGLLVTPLTKPLEFFQKTLPLYREIQAHSGLEISKAPFMEKVLSALKAYADEVLSRSLSGIDREIEKLAEVFNAFKSFDTISRATFNESIDCEEDSNKAKALKALKDLAEQIAHGRPNRITSIMGVFGF